MKLRDDIYFYHLGQDYTAVDPGRTCERESYVFPMNEAAAMLWERFQGREADVEVMADVLCEAYDISREVAVHDIQELLHQWQDFGLII